VIARYGVGLFVATAKVVISPKLTLANSSAESIFDQKEILNLL
jgi:hypothetical protein